MNIVKCANGHDYDDDVFSECPFCSNQGRMPLVNVREPEISKTEVLNEYDKSLMNDGAQQSSDGFTNAGGERPQVGAKAKKSAGGARSKGDPARNMTANSGPNPNGYPNLNPNLNPNGKKPKGGKAYILIIVLSILSVGLLTALLIVLFAGKTEKNAEISPDTGTMMTEMTENTDVPFTESTNIPFTESTIAQITETTEKEQATEKPVEVVALSSFYVTLEKQAKDSSDAQTRQMFILEDGGSIVLREGCRAEVSILPEPADAEVKEVKWQISDADRITIAEISKTKGMLSVETLGNTKLVEASVVAKAVSGDGSTKEISFTVQIIKAGWYQEGKNWYFIGGDDVKYTGLRNVAGDTYYFDEHGVVQEGFQKIEGDTYYFGEDNKMLKNDWLKTKEDEVEVWYYFREDGTMISGTTETIDGTEYTFDDEGRWIKE